MVEKASRFFQTQTSSSSLNKVVAYVVAGECSTFSGQVVLGNMGIQNDQLPQLIDTHPNISLASFQSSPWPLAKETSQSSDFQAFLPLLLNFSPGISSFFFSVSTCGRLGCVILFSLYALSRFHFSPYIGTYHHQCFIAFFLSLFFKCIDNPLEKLNFKFLLLIIFL
jgi:hypothetical protein